ncbi:DUF4225 domain-containing protein [Pseudomonas sp. 5P_5.1_Bac1]|uniref:DUF4225 domain-containing protein n=1 Tax=Pseudomonas sp. 5P_5.1_Bac1 TaxID=2971616 RepID=UPI0021C7B225|nr:DUF4225 domain-containing protein [Pseudomonas sp. 5P_5.1_Bac1]MCU1724801.1 DUF4225 domain-containing protein [Pseudomonas sp. 5P_5.1_Bac1]
MSTRPSPYRLDNQLSELHQSAANLTRYACIVRSRHIKDGVLRGRFNRTMAYYVRQVLEDVRNGKIRTEEGLKQIEVEHKSISRIGLEVGGVIAGASMMTTGVGVCYGSAMTVCAVAGAPMVAHGANNIYENGANLSSGRSDAVGPLKKLYQGVAVAAGGSESNGSVAYGSVDVLLSIYGFYRPLPKPGTWQLFRPIKTDYVPAYKLMNKGALLFEAIMGAWTASQVYEEAKK